MKNRLFDIISSGLPPDTNIEPLRKIVLINLIILPGSFFLGVLGVIATFEHDFVLAIADLLILLFLLGLFYYLRKTKNHTAVGFIGTVTVGAFYAFLVAYGGVSKTAYVWCFTYPLITLFLLGTKKGTWFSLALLIVVCAAFALGRKIDFITAYRIDLIIRFIPAYFIIYLFAVVMERVRAIVQSRLEASNLELEETLRVLQEKTDELTVSNRDLQSEIGHRERVEKALRDSEGFLEDVIESIQDGISVLNPDLTIRHTNQVMQKWYRDNMPLVGKKCHVCYHNQDQPCDPCPTLRSLKSGKTENETVPGLPASSIEWLELYSFPIKDNETGTVTGVVEFVRDITAHRQLENQLARAERMDSIGRLAGGVAHDFNNILMGIQGRVSLMLMDAEPDHPFVDPLKGIQSYVRNASQLTGQLLGFARGGKYEVKPTDLNQLIHDNMVMFGRTKKELRINSTFQHQLWPAEVDQGQLNQVFLNLFVNAWEAMPDGGDLSVSTQNVILDKGFAGAHGLSSGNHIKIQVMDTGVGIDKESLSRIFDPFFTTKGIGKGTGLGLASVYGIIKNHKGVVTVKSGLKEGTTFTIYLPATRRTVKNDASQGESIVNGSETVLLVDDEDMIVEVGSELLSRLGYKVLTARNGREAIAIYETRKNDISCVILDMIMPDQNGGDTFDRLKRLNDEIKVLLSSGYSRDGQAQQIMNRGCSGFIQKPFTLEDLSFKIRQVLENG